MSVRSGSPVNEARMAARPDVAVTVRAGLIGGLIGGVSIWIYEAIVWVGVQHLMPLGGIPRNATNIGPVSIKYDPRNPANSIVLSEEWSGLRTAHRVE